MWTQLYRLQFQRLYKNCTRNLLRCGTLFATYDAMKEGILRGHLKENYIANLSIAWWCSLCTFAVFLPLEIRSTEKKIQMSRSIFEIIRQVIKIEPYKPLINRTINLATRALEPAFLLASYDKLLSIYNHETDCF